MNCRYIIVGDELPPLEYRHAKGNAWFEQAKEKDRVELVSYAPNELAYEYESAEGGKLVFSAVYYPAGWKLTLDGVEELEIGCEASLLRCAEVPAGRHSLVMRFDPPSYRIGEGVSRASSIALILVVLLSLCGVVLPGLLRRK